MDDSGRSDRARIPFAWLAAAVVVSVVATTFVVQVDNSALGAGGASNVKVVGKKFVKIDEGAKRTLMRNGRLQVRVNCPENNNPEVSIRVELRSFRNGAVMVDGNQLTKLSGDWVIIGSEANESTESGQRDVDILYRDKVGYRVHVTYAINTLNADCVAFGSVTNA